MIKLIATDLDGTLFHPKRHFTTMTVANKRFLRDSIADGIRVIFVSGRNPTILKRLEKITHTDPVLLGCNGSYLYEHGHTTVSYPMDPVRLKELISYLYERFAIVTYFLFDDTTDMYLALKDLPTGSRPIFLASNYLNYAYREKIVIDEERFFQKLNTPNHKLMIHFGFAQLGRNKAIETYHALLNTRFDDYFEFAPSDGAVEITAKGVDKGRMLTEYCQREGIDPEEVIVCGDSGNDITMFTRFPHSFAMSSAPEYVRDHANHIIDRVSDLKEYLADQSLMENDVPKEYDLISSLLKPE